jgi:hypothetical protein
MAATPEVRTLVPIRSPLDYMKISAGIAGPGIQALPPLLKTTPGKAFQKLVDGVVTRTIQNLGTTPMYYAVQDNQPAYTSAVFHGIVPPGTAADDGYGGIVDLSKYTQAVWVWTLTGTLRALCFAAVDDSILNSLNRVSSDAGVDALVLGDV